MHSRKFTQYAKINKNLGCRDKKTKRQSQKAMQILKAMQSQKGQSCRVKKQGQKLANCSLPFLFEI